MSSDDAVGSTPRASYRRVSAGAASRHLYWRALMGRCDARARGCMQKAPRCGAAVSERRGKNGRIEQVDLLFGAEPPPVAPPLKPYPPSTAPPRHRKR